MRWWPFRTKREITLEEVKRKCRDVSLIHGSAVVKANMSAFCRGKPPHVNNLDPEQYGAFLQQLEKEVEFKL